MKISEAIKILEDLQTNLPQRSPEDRRKAVKLGEEALKGIIAIRCGAIFYVDEPLPEETF